MRLLGVLLPGGDLAVESGQLPSRVCPPPSTTLGTSRLLCPWNSPGKNTGVGSHSLLQGIFPAQGLNLGLLHGRWILYLPEPAEKPYFPESHHHSCRRPPTTHIRPSLHPSPGSGPPALTPLGTLGHMVRSLERCPLPGPGALGSPHSPLGSMAPGRTCKPGAWTQRPGMGGCGQRSRS